MLIACFNYGEGRHWGLVEGEQLRRLEGDIFSGISPTEDSIPLAEVDLLPPVQPSKVIAVGLNYVDHIGEAKRDIPQEPVLFLKSPGSLVGHGQPIILPQTDHRIDYEGEVAVVISQVARRVPPEKAYDYILGCTCSGDISDRHIQRSDGQWSRAKSFDTFTPLGPWLATGLNYGDLGLTTHLNGELRQSTRTSKMLFDIPTLIHFISSSMTLYPGDVILTGTPSGVGPLDDGDELSIWVEGVGTLSHPVVREE